MARLLGKSLSWRFPCRPVHFPFPLFRFPISNFRSAGCPRGLFGQDCGRRGKFQWPGYFRFKLVDHNGSALWSNAAAAVNRGHYSVLLGDDAPPHGADTAQPLSRPSGGVSAGSLFAGRRSWPAFRQARLQHAHQPWQLPWLPCRFPVHGPIGNKSFPPHFHYHPIFQCGYMTHATASLYVAGNVSFRTGRVLGCSFIIRIFKKCGYVSHAVSKRKPLGRIAPTREMRDISRGHPFHAPLPFSIPPTS